MKAERTTKKELLVEVEALRERISELEAYARECRSALRDCEEQAARSFPEVTRMPGAVFVAFARKLEFVDDRFAELFGIAPEEACCCNFDPMTLVAPESRRFIGELHWAACRGGFATKEFSFIGLSRDGRRIACEASVVCIPYKWGIAIQGTVRDIAVARRSAEAWQPVRKDEPVVLNTSPGDIVYADRGHRIGQATGAAHH